MSKSFICKLRQPIASAMGIKNKQRRGIVLTIYLTHVTFIYKNMNTYRFTYKNPKRRLNGYDICFVLFICTNVPAGRRCLAN
jgi:hypothetical protein